MGLGGGGRSLRVVLAMLALVLLAGAATMSAWAEEPALQTISDCSAQPSTESRGTIVGRAFIDQAEDGTFEPGEPHFDVPLEDIEVRLHGEGLSEITLSDSDGCYAFNDLEPGTYWIETALNPTSGLTRLHHEPVEIVITNGEMQESSLRYVRLLVQPGMVYLPVVARQ